MKRVSSGRHLSTNVALWHLGLRQTLKGAIVLGLFVGTMAVVQGLAFGATYPDEKSRAAFAATMESAPALGLLYGETKNLASSAGYMVYRTVPVMGIIASVWALMATAKLLRGQEEDGRWEAITAASTTPRQATSFLFLGFGASLAIAYLTSTAMIIAAGTSPDLTLAVGTAALITLTIYLPALLFGSLAIFASQLAFTRRRAVMYGLVPLVGFFIVRSIANTAPDLYWLKNLTPFGWADQVSPIFNPQLGWLIAFVVVTPLLASTGIYLAAKRDLGAGLIPESTTQKPRLYLLGSPTGLALRHNLSLFISWGITALSICTVVASLMSIAAEAVADSPNLKVFITQFGGSVDDLKVAFLGAGLVFIVIALLIMATTCMASIRRDEAKNYLDNLLTQPVRRSSWLSMRLLIVVVAFVTISMACALATWFVALLQNIHLDLGNMLLLSITLVGTVLFTLGLGTLLYGIFPRIAVIGMYVVIAWSFIIDVVGSVIALDQMIIKSSLLHYVSLSPTTSPDWTTFAWLSGIGTAMAVLGIIAFTKRDIITE